MNKKAKKMFYSWFDFILGVGQIGSIIMAIYRFVLLMAYTTRDTPYNIEELAAPIALWFFIAGVVSIIRDKIEYDDFNDELCDEEE